MKEYRFTPRFDIGETVWYVRDGVLIGEYTVVGITHHIFKGDGDPIFTLYDIDDGDGRLCDIEEYYLFPQTEEFKKMVKEWNKNEND